MQMNSIFFEYIRLMRLHQPTGFLLLFWPCAFGIVLASEDGVPWGLLLIFLIGSMVMRAAGCIVNDIIDQDIDKHVARTKTRPIASGSISTKQAILFLIPLLIIGAAILFTLTKTAIYIGLFSIILIVIYPFMKRITNYPQAFLAFTFNIGALIGYATVQNKITWSAALLYIACWFWTLGYDTIYGYQDTKYDKKIGIKSTSITFEKHSKIFLYCCYAIMIILLFILSFVSQTTLLSYYALTFVMMHLLWQVYSLNEKSPENCLQRFKSNGYYLGAVILLVFVLDAIPTKL